MKRETAKKNRMFRESMKSKTTEAKEKYQEQRKKVKHMVKVKLKQFYHKIIEKHAAKSNRKFFQLIRNLSGNEREKVQNLNQKEVNDFNHFFATIGEKLNKNFRQSECSLKNQQVPSMFLLPRSKKELLIVIQDSKSKYSEDYMDLNYIFIKSVAVSIARYLSKLINRCFQEGIFPDSLKKASIIPPHKEGEKNEPNNFRPISLLPTLGKIFEKVILIRISNYFKDFEILNSKQFGFREKRGNVDADSSLVELIRSSKHSYTEHTYCTFLDLRKAFDTIDRKILLQKCKMYGLRGPVSTVLESYLKNRKQFVQSGQRKSQMTEVKYGVPQGSILGPLLFIVYINDLKTNSPCSNFIFYADDTAVYTKSNEANACREHQLILSQTENWLKMNKLTLNTDKSKTITFKSKHDRSDVFTMNGKRLEKINSLSYLGIKN